MRKVAVFDTLGSANLGDVLDAAGGWCEPVIVNAGGTPWNAADLTALDGVVDHIDASGLGADRICELLAGRGVGGVVTFGDDLLRLVAAVAGRLGLPGHDLDTATALTRKDTQRRRLAAAGVERMRCAAFSTGAGMAAAARTVGFPAVLKPAFGTGSTNVFAVDDLAELIGAVRRANAERLRMPRLAAEVLGFDPAAPWQLEELLPAGAHPAADWLGDYVSVETVALGGGEYWHFCVTDRLPLAWPFRETGALAPTLLPEDVQEQVCRLASAALAALGVTCGLAHTEIKLTPDGPRVIEVNGRLGGFIGRMVGRVSDLDPVELALRAALGEATPQPVPTRGYALVMFVQPPASAGALVRAADPATLRAVPGVWRVDSRVRPGEPVDFRTGSLGRVQTVWVAADTPAELAAACQRVNAILAEAEYRPVPASGGAAADGALRAEVAADFATGLAAWHPVAI